MSTSSRKRCASEREIVRTLEDNGIKHMFSGYDLAKGCMILVFAANTDIDYWVQSGQVEVNGPKAEEVVRMLDGATPAAPQIAADNHQVATPGPAASTDHTDIDDQTSHKGGQL